MAKIQNVSGEDRYVPSLGGRLVTDQQVIEVPDSDVYGFTQQLGVWAAVDDDAEAAHDADHQAYLARRSEELGGVPVDNDGAPLPPAEVEEPAGNATREAWADYVVAAGLATPEDLDGKGRDEIRDTYAHDGSN